MDMITAMSWNPMKYAKQDLNMLKNRKYLRLECDLNHFISRIYIPPFPGWRERGLSWWRSQTTR